MADTKYIREKLEMSQKEFAEFFGISLGTVKNWDSRNCMPTYVNNILLRYILEFEGHKRYFDKYIDLLSLHIQ